ncbi:MAG: hypothetical protein NVS4B12_17090 [Ktedonobacteraceae bacterium]
MQKQQYPPPNSGPLATLSEVDKKKRLDAMVKIWQSDTERRFAREGAQAVLQAMGLDEYRYAISLRFPEWERAAVVGQVLAVQQGESSETPTLLSVWRRDPLLRGIPDWKEQLPNETVFNIAVRITPGGLGEGSKWAVVMPKEMIPRYKPGWPTQQEWVTWTRSFDWLSVGIGFIRAMLDAPR